MKKAAALFAVSLFLWCAASWRRPHAQTVEIVRDGKTIAVIDLSAETAPRTLTLKSPDGGFNTLLIERGRIRVLSADCPGRDCVNMGWLRSASAPLVCLPHRLIVRYADGAAGALDGVSR